MSRVLDSIVVDVLADGAVEGKREEVHIRSLNSIEYLDMQAELDAVAEDETRKKRDKVKVGIAIKLAAAVCDESGAQRFAGADQAMEFMRTISFKDVIAIVEPINESTALTDKALDKTEKK